VRPIVVYDASVIKRLYIHNYRCLENFDLPISERSSTLLIGRNGTGKTAVGLALRILKRIGRGANRVDIMVKPRDFFRGRTDVPLRIEIEVGLEGENYAYAIALEFVEKAKEVGVLEEKLTVDGKPIYTRAGARVYLARGGKERKAQVRIDWHLVALPIIQEESTKDPLFVFKQWLARMLILRPMPSLIKGDSERVTLAPHSSVTNFGAWFSGLVSYAPSAYNVIEEYLKQVMPDLKDIKNPLVGKDNRSLSVQFSNGQGSLNLPFEDLSDGEKCFMICALVLAANDAYGPLLCFWDEPDNYLALSEVGQFVLALRKAFQSGGQFIATSHHPEAIRSFADENTLVLSRRSHLEPTIVRPLAEVRASGDFSGDLVGALIRGDLEP
jgi:predicted ATPase